jgi:serine/threonine protein kinase
MNWAKGQQLQNGKYVIEKMLGTGGFGITYKARHTFLNYDVVIKTPNEDVKSEPNYAKYVERFIKEGQMLAQLSNDPHPHIVRISDLFQEGDTHCLVMDFIPGETLWKLVGRKGALLETEAVEYIRQIGSALSVLHEKGLVHLDVTPYNIMVRSSGNAVLIDFGIAGDMSPSSSFSRSFGNKAFAPYELFEGVRHPTVDIYTLAASLYYAVTGERPAKSSDRKDYSKKTKFVSPKELVSQISDEVNRAILIGMELKPEDRPQSIQEWLELLPRDVSKTSIIQTPSSTASTPPPQKLRSISWGWLAAPFYLISWSTFREITLAAKNYVQSKQRWLKSLVARLTLKPLIKRNPSFKVKVGASLHQKIRNIPWSWLTTAFIGYVFTGLLFAASPSPALAQIGAFAGASIGAFVGAFTEVELGALTRRVVQVVNSVVLLIVSLLLIGVSLALCGVCLPIVVTPLALSLALLLASVDIGATLLALVLTWAGAEATAKSLFWLGAVVRAWAEAVAKYGIRVFAWTLETVIKVFAWVFAEAGGWTEALVGILGWALALTWIVALADVLAWTGKKLSKSFSRFHRIIILALTSWAGLGLGWLATSIF